MPIESWDTPHSSNVSKVSYNPETQEMTVAFKNGVYAVSGVAATTASDMANDPSPGSFYNRHIRNLYTVRKVG